MSERQVMRIAIYPIHPLQYQEVEKALSDAGLLDKADIEIYPCPDRLKFQRQPSMTIVHPHQLKRGDDGRAYCQVCGRSFPLNPAGEIDEEALLKEMTLPTRSFSS